LLLLSWRQQARGRQAVILTVDFLERRTNVGISKNIQRKFEEQRTSRSTPGGLLKSFCVVFVF
jgi:hypothetical protein